MTPPTRGMEVNEIAHALQAGRPTVAAVCTGARAHGDPDTHAYTCAE